MAGKDFFGTGTGNANGCGSFNQSALYFLDVYQKKIVWKNYKTEGNWINFDPAPEGIANLGVFCFSHDSTSKLLYVG